MNDRNFRFFLVAIVGSVALIACGLYLPDRVFGRLTGSQYASNGERIYFTATSGSGNRIRYRGGSSGGMMMGRLTCASCHGEDGRGGEHFMHMNTMDAPDIRWETLSSIEHGGHEGSDENDELPYDAEAFSQAVREGITPGGDRLSSEMPRWEMSNEDLQDLIAFLKTLD
jgi:hypothetical protein